MARRGSRKHGTTEGIREERAGLILRYTVDAAEAEAADEEPPAPSPAPARATEYAIDLDLAAGFLWRWSLFELIELGGEEGEYKPMSFRSPEPTASARFPRLSRKAALRAGERAAQRLSSPPAARPAIAARSRRVVQVALVLLAAAVLAGAFVATRRSLETRRTPVTPPRTSRPTTRPSRKSLLARSPTTLNNEGYAKMRRGDYAAARPLLEVAVRRLRGSGSFDEAYAEFNLASTQYHLGKCAGILALLEHSQQIQGPNAAIDDLRSAARKTCS